MKQFRRQKYFFKLLRPFCYKIFRRQDFQRWGISDETNFVAKKHFQCQKKWTFSDIYFRCCKYIWLQFIHIQRRQKPTISTKRIMSLSLFLSPRNMQLPYEGTLGRGGSITHTSTPWKFPLFLKSMCTMCALDIFHEIVQNLPKLQLTRH